MWNPFSSSKKPQPSAPDSKQLEEAQAVLAALQQLNQKLLATDPELPQAEIDAREEAILDRIRQEGRGI